jgi:hypothetical protein
VTAIRGVIFGNLAEYANMVDFEPPSDHIAASAAVATNVYFALMCFCFAHRLGAMYAALLVVAHEKFRRVYVAQQCMWEMGISKLSEALWCGR